MSNMLVNFGALKFEEGTTHINKMPFSGICLKAETPSDATPNGADKPVAFSLDAINNAISTFADMGVNCVYDRWDSPEYALTGHDQRFKIGVVEKAELTENGVLINGCLWQNDFRDVCFQIKNAKESLGFSVEVCVNDMSDKGDYYLINDFTFTGVAILYKNLAAFRETQLNAQKKNKQKGVDNFMNNEQFEQFMAKVESIGSDISAKMVEFSEKLDKIEGKEASIDFSAVIDAIKELKEVQKVDPTNVTASANPNTNEPTKKTAGIQFEGKTDGQELSFAEQIAKIDKDLSLSENEKLQKKMGLWRESLKNK